MSKAYLSTIPITPLPGRNRPPGSRQKENPAAKTRMAKKRQEARDAFPFVAIDSEGRNFGAAFKRDGTLWIEHHTILWMAGDETGETRELVPLAGKAYCEGLHIIEWLLSLRETWPEAIFVSYAFNYDATQIFSSLPLEVARDIHRAYPSRFTEPPGRRVPIFWRGYHIDYMAGKWLELARLDDEGHVINGTRIKIFDVFSFFQSSFLKAAENVAGAITDRERAIIEKGKAARGEFEKWTLDELREYTGAELRVLSRMMGIVREALAELGIKLKSWHGPGAVAKEVLKKHEIPRWLKSSKSPLSADPAKMSEQQKAAHIAFFGGHIELYRQGVIASEFFDYDLASAYPAEMVDLPPMHGGEWRFERADFHLRGAKKEDKDFYEKWLSELSPYSMVEIETTGEIPNAIGYPLPYRLEDDCVIYPPNIRGYYFAREAAAAFRWARVNRRGSWDFIIRSAHIFKPAPPSRCSNQRPFSFVPDYFARRASLPKTSMLGWSIKLILNSLYGKQAQSRGEVGKVPDVFNPWVAGAITAGTRARILDAIARDMDAVIMIATDGLFTTRELPVAVNRGAKALGTWEVDTLPAGLFIQSGVYFDGKNVKTRGFNPNNVRAADGSKLSKDELAEFMWREVPRAWTKRRDKLKLSADVFQTLGRGVVNEASFELAGYWGLAAREVNVNSAGAKRKVMPADPRRARELVPTWPKSVDGARLFDQGGAGVPMSKPAAVEWLLTLDEQAELGDIDAETQIILMG
jgi:hypothetical protein